MHASLQKMYSTPRDLSTGMELFDGKRGAPLFSSPSRIRCSYMNVRAELRKKFTYVREEYASI